MQKGYYGIALLCLFGRCAEIPTIDQNPELQTDALKDAGCEKIFTEKASESNKDRPQLQATIEYMRTGDILVVWKLYSKRPRMTICRTAEILEKVKTVVLSYM